MIDDDTKRSGNVGDVYECKHKLYQVIDLTVNAYLNCVKSNNLEWADKHRMRIRELESVLPHGSGLDNNTIIELSECKNNKIVIYTSFHHMGDNGMYDGWTDHKIIITPSFIGIDIRITGPNRNDIKEYLYQIFDDRLNEVVQ